MRVSSLLSSSSFALVIHLLHSRESIESIACILAVVYPLAQGLLINATQSKKESEANVCPASASLQLTLFCVSSLSPLFSFSSRVSCGTGHSSRPDCVNFVVPDDTKCSSVFFRSLIFLSLSCCCLCRGVLIALVCLLPVTNERKCIQWTRQCRPVQASGEYIIRLHRTRQPGNSFEYQMMKQCKRDYLHYLSLSLSLSHPAPFFSLILCARNFNFKLIVPMKLKL